MKEIWKDIEGLEGDYQISNLGRLRSLTRTITKSDGYTYTRKGKIIKPQERQGYLRGRVSVMKVKATYSIHRLVATAFIPNPENKEQVNHINENKADNRVANLEWVTPKENVQHSFKLGNRKPLSKSNKARPVLNVKTGIYYKSLLAASKTITNISYSGLQHQMNGVVKNTAGFIYA